MNGPEIGNAMVLAAGMGLRLRPLTDTRPKPLVMVAGKTLIDRCLDTLAIAGVRRAVVNVHHLPDMIIAHLADRKSPQVFISDERDHLLDSAGGIIKALPELGRDPFFVVNADTFWIDGRTSNLQLLEQAWRPADMDMLLMLVSPEKATGHSGRGDFLLDEEGRLRRACGAAGAAIYAGAAIVDPRIFEGASPDPHSLNVYFDRAISRSRLYGFMMEGQWITVGTPDAIISAEGAVRAATSA